MGRIGKGHGKLATWDLSVSHDHQSVTGNMQKSNTSEIGYGFDPSAIEPRDHTIKMKGLSANMIKTAGEKKMVKIILASVFIFPPPQISTTDKSA
jgi:hypothetical protein